MLRLTRAEVAWAAVGDAVGAYEAAVRYTKERVQFGKPIAVAPAHPGPAREVDRQHHRRHRHVRARLARCSTRASSATSTRRSPRRIATARMRETVAWCREVLGGNGIVLDYDVARFFADAEALYSYEGTREMNTLIVGRAITG